MLDRLEFMLSEAFLALRRNRWMTFAAISTATTALFLLGGLTYLFLRVSLAAGELQDRVEMRVFLKEGTPMEAKAEVMKSIAQIPGVRQAWAIPKEQAWKEYRAKFPDVTEGLENPLPDSVRVALSDLKQATTISAAIQKLPQVEPDGVKYMDEAREFVTEGMKTLRWLGASLGLIMLFTSGILIYNTIRMTIVARRREIRIMELVGATKSMILTPMMIEGIVQGAIGGVLAGLLMFGCHTGVARLMQDYSVRGDIGAFPLGFWVGSLAALGAVYGFVCSALAMRASPPV